MKQLVSFILLIVCFFKATSPVQAKVFINEFSSGTGSDWIEIYNDGSQEEPLSDYLLRDETSTNKLELNGILSPKGYMVFEWGDRLNNPGDSIRLVKSDSETEEVDKVIYGTKEGSNITAPTDSQFAARILDGQSNWALYTTHTKGQANANSNPIPSLTPTPTDTPKPTSTPTKLPTPTKTPTPQPEPTTPEKVSTGVLGTTIKPSPTVDYKVPTAVFAKETEKEFLESVHVAKKPEVKTKGIAAVNPSIILMGVGTLFLLSCLGFGYHSYRNGKL